MVPFLLPHEMIPSPNTEGRLSGTVYTGGKSKLQCNQTCCWIDPSWWLEPRNISKMQTGSSSCATPAALCLPQDYVGKQGGQLTESSGHRVWLSHYIPRCTAPLCTSTRLLALVSQLSSSKIQSLMGCGSWRLKTDESFYPCLSLEPTSLSAQQLTHNSKFLVLHLTLSPVSMQFSQAPYNFYF